MHLFFVPKKGRPAFVRPRLSKHVKVCNTPGISLLYTTHNETETGRNANVRKLLTAFYHDLYRKTEKQDIELDSILGLDLGINHFSGAADLFVFPGQEISHQPIRAPGRYPEFTSVSQRLQTFAAWDLPFNEQRRNSLAYCGFFYTGQADLVRCYQCGLGLKDWSDDDDPLVEHIRYSPNCGHLEDTVHPFKLKYYKDIVKLLQPSNGIDLRKVNPQTRRIHQSPQYLDYHSRFDTFLSFPRNTGQSPEQLAKAGFFFTGIGDRVRCFSCNGGLRNFCPDDNPWTEHARWFPNCIHVRSEMGDAFVRMVQNLHISNNSAEDGAQGQASHAANARVTYCKESELKKENRKLKAKLKCILCGENDINCLFLPCTHLKMCMDCSKNVTKCPVCCKYIQERIKIYMS